VACKKQIKNVRNLVVEEIEWKSSLEELKVDGKIKIIAMLKKEGGKTWA